MAAITSKCVMNFDEAGIFFYNQMTPAGWNTIDSSFSWRENASEYISLFFDISIE